MDEKEKIRVLELNLSRLLQWISAAESRIAVTLGVNTALLGTLFALAPSPSTWTMAAAVAGGIAICCVSVSIGCLALASFPRTDGPKQSYIFFRGIVAREENQYLKDYSVITQEAYFDDLARQCYRNAQIASEKFTWVRRAQAWLFVSVVPWVGTLAVLYSR